MNKSFVITGQERLTGEYPVQGNKNAALPLICASLLMRGKIRFRDVPRIRDVFHLLELLHALGVDSRWNHHELELDTRNVAPAELPSELVRKLRGAILILGAVANEFGSIRCALPGGCPIGRRSFDVHWDAFRAAGFSVSEDFSGVRLDRIARPETPRLYLEEASVTATENALLLFSSLGKGLILNPAREPHILSLIEFLRLAGCEVEMHPLYYRIVRGIVNPAAPIEFHVPADYIDAGTIAIGAAVTGGDVILQGVRSEELMGIQPFLERFGVRFESLGEKRIRAVPSGNGAPPRITAGPWPLFPTDLVSLAIVLATQRKGLCLVHDWMYEARMFFVDKLIRMGAHITMCDPHRVLVEGPARLRGTRLESPDIRAGMALVVAGMCAQGVTIIDRSEVIQRGYENVVERLSGIGAKIFEEGGSVPDSESAVS